MRTILADRDYERLTPRERLIMLSQALARKDEAEARRLHETVPMKPYRCADLEFDAPFEALWYLVYLLAIFLNTRLGRLWMIAKMQRSVAPIMQAAVQEALPKLFDLMGNDAEEKLSQTILGEMNKPGTQATDNHSIAPESELNGKLEAKMADFFQQLSSNARESVRKIYDDLFVEVAGEVSALMQTFDRFTRDLLDLDGLTVLRAWMLPVAKTVEQLGFADYPPDEELLAEFGPFWGRTWNGKMEFQGLARGTHASETSPG